MCLWARSNVVESNIFSPQPAPGWTALLVNAPADESEPMIVFALDMTSS
jgi:hypothetical protein